MSITLRVFPYDTFAILYHAQKNLTDLSRINSERKFIQGTDHLAEILRYAVDYESKKNNIKKQLIDKLEKETIDGSTEDDSISVKQTREKLLQQLKSEKNKIDEMVAKKLEASVYKKYYPKTCKVQFDEEKLSQQVMQNMWEGKKPLKSSSDKKGQMQELQAVLFAKNKMTQEQQKDYQIQFMNEAFKVMHGIGTTGDQWITYKNFMTTWCKKDCTFEGKLFFDTVISVHGYRWFQSNAEEKHNLISCDISESAMKNIQTLCRAVRQKNLYATVVILKKIAHKIVRSINGYDNAETFEKDKMELDEDDIYYEDYIQRVTWKDGARRSDPLKYSRIQMIDTSNMLVVLEAIFGEYIIHRLIQYIRFIVMGITASRIVSEEDPCAFVASINNFSKNFDKKKTEEKDVIKNANQPEHTNHVLDSFHKLTTKIIAEAIPETQQYYRCMCSYVMAVVEDPSKVAHLDKTGFFNVKMHAAILRTIIPSLVLNMFRLRLNLVLQKTHTKYTRKIFQNERVIQDYESKIIKVIDMGNRANYQYPLYVKLTRYPPIRGGVYFFKGDYFYSNVNNYINQFYKAQQMATKILFFTKGLKIPASLKQGQTLWEEAQEEYKNLVAVGTEENTENFVSKPVDAQTKLNEEVDAIQGENKEEQKSSGEEQGSSYEETSLQQFAQKLGIPIGIIERPNSEVAKEIENIVEEIKNIVGNQLEPDEEPNKEQGLYIRTVSRETYNIPVQLTQNTQKPLTGDDIKELKDTGVQFAPGSIEFVKDISLAGASNESDNTVLGGKDAFVARILSQWDAFKK